MILLNLLYISLILGIKGEEMKCTANSLINGCQFSSTRYKAQLVGQHIYLHPKITHKSTLIWVNLHGLGDTANGYLDIFNDPKFFMKVTPDDMKVILLTAPERALSRYGGQIMTSWFDMKLNDWQEKIDTHSVEQLFDVDELAASTKFITEVIDKEKEVVGENIFIGGFSQGCAIALHVGLSLDYQIKGILGFSGFLFPQTKLQNQKAKILLSHGTRDERILLSTAQWTYKRLEGSDVRFEIIQGLEHSFNQKSFEIIYEFLKD